MRNSFKIVFIALLISIPTAGFSQKAFKFGHLNSEEILKGLPEMDSVQVKMQKYVKDLQDGLELMQVEYNKKLDDYQKTKDGLVDLVKQNKEKELVTMQQNIQQYQENAQQNMQQKQADLMQPVRDKVKKAISDVGKENGFTYIFDTVTGSLAYFSSESQDVTDLVKQKLGVTKTTSNTKPANNTKGATNKK